MTILRILDKHAEGSLAEQAKAVAEFVASELRKKAHALSEDGTDGHAQGIFDAADFVADMVVGKPDVIRADLVAALRTYAAQWADTEGDRGIAMAADFIENERDKL